MNISALYKDYHDRSGEQSSNQNSFVAASLLYIVQHYFIKWSSYFVLTLSCHRNHTCNFYNDMFQKMFNKWQEWPLQIVKVEKNETKIVPGLRRFNMIMVDSYESFLDTQIHSYTSKYNTNENYFIFLQSRDSLLLSEMQKIFEYCWLHYLINCIVQIQTANGTILHYTYYPFTQQYCGKIEPVLVNQYNGKSLVIKNLFPKKLNNFFGCPLRAAVWHVPPYLYLATDSKNTKYISGGFEGKLLLLLAKKFNFSLEIIEPPNNSQRGIIMPNGTLTGALNMLKAREVDLSLGAFRASYPRMQVVSSTISYHQTPFVAIALKEAFQLTSLEIFLYPFSKNTWYLVVTICLIASGIMNSSKFLCKARYENGLRNNTLAILQVFLGMPITHEPQSHFSRIINVTWMIYALILRTIYGALLFHLIRTHVTRNIPQTLEQLSAEKYTMLATEVGVNAFKEIAIMKTFKQLLVNESVDGGIFPLLENLTLHSAKNIFTGAPLVVLDYYAHRYRKWEVFEVMPDYIMNGESCMYLSKHSFLIDHLNNILIWIKAYGLLEGWSRENIDINFLYKAHVTAGDRVFGMRQLSMIFVGLCGGLMVSMVIFIWELLQRKC